MEPQPLCGSGQVSNVAVAALMQKYFPTYQHELAGSKLLPATALYALKSALPEEAFCLLMTHSSEKGTLIHQRNPWGTGKMVLEEVPDSRSIRFGEGVRSCRVRDVCKNKKCMVVLYLLIATEKVTWDLAWDFVNYVHFLEGIQIQANNILIQTLMQKYWPTYEHDLTGSRLLPKTVLDTLMVALPDTDYNELMSRYSEPAVLVDPCGIKCSDFSTTTKRQVRVRKLCENKRVMVVLCHLVATGQVSWEHGLDFLNYVQVLEGNPW